MKLSRSQLQPSNSPLIGFGGKRIDALGKIFLPVSFGGQENARTEYVTFDIVDLYYPYNAIFRTWFANKFNIAIHMGYLCMKMLALHRIITVHGSQKEARNVERESTNLSAISTPSKQLELIQQSLWTCRRGKQISRTKKKRRQSH